MPWLRVNQTAAVAPSAVPTPLLALDVQRAGMPGQPGAWVALSSSMRYPLGRSVLVARRVLALELEPVARTREVGAEHAALGARSPVEQQLLDPDVVVELLEVPQARRGAADVQVQRRSAVRRERQRVRVAQRGHLAGSR